MSSFYSVIGCSFISPSKTSDWNICIPASMKRRDPRIWHVAYSAAHKVITDTECTPKSIITGTALGALDETKNFLDTVFDTGFGNPRYFISSVHNSMAGKIALEFKIEGPNITACDGQNSLASSIALLDSLSGDDFPALIILVDEHIELLDRLQPQFSSFCNAYLKSDWEDGAVAVIVSNKIIPNKPKVRSFPPSICATTPDASVRNMINTYIPDFKEEISLQETSCSYLQPAISLCNVLTDTTQKRSVIGSYSPASDSCALVEIIDQR